MSIDIRLVSSLEAFENLQDEWNSLYEKCEQATVFNSWDWMFTWWEVFHHELKSQLHILCLYKDSTLVGIAPFQITNTFTFPKSIIQGKTLCFIGSGEAVQDKVVSQYMDFLVLSDMQEVMIEVVANYLDKNKDKWDFADFEFLLEGSQIAKCFQTKNAQLHLDLATYGRQFYIKDLTSFDEYTAQLENRWRKMFQKKNRKLEAAGDVSIDTSDNIESAINAFHQLVKMHEERWKNRTHVNIFQSEKFTNFHLKLLERLAPQGKAKITTLSLNNTPLATYYYFKDKGQLHYYQSGFYSEHANRYSPLFLLICNEIKSAIEDKLTFDFMFDDNEDTYKKKQYAADSRTMYRLRGSPYKSRVTRYLGAKVVQNTYLKISKELLNSKRYFRP